VGGSGIVVQETENTFKVVTRKNRLKGAVSDISPGSVALMNADPNPSTLTVLPKQGSVFTFAVPLYSTEPSTAAGGSVVNSGTNAGSRSSSDARHAETVLDIPHIEFELYGNQFCFRAADRAGRKFKHKETIEL
jgi:ribonuclease P protein subunit POP4